MMRLPDFLIIGAMKAGTTSLYRDLLTNPQIFMPTDKELDVLTTDVSKLDKLQEYASHFRRASADQICGEASTGYTKRPTFEDVPKRARNVLGENLKVIYLVREPVARAISHHHHTSRISKTSTTFDEAVKSDHTLINYGRYAMQIEPWLRTLGSKSVCIVRFESYIIDRRGTAERLCRFLGVEPRPERIEADRIFNRSEDKPYLTGKWHWVRHNIVYDRLLRPLIPLGARESMRRILLPAEPVRRAIPSPDTVQYLIDHFQEDSETLRDLMAWPEPLWDFNQVATRSQGG